MTGTGQATHSMPHFTAVVRDVHGVRFVAAAHSRGELEAQVVDYIGGRCDHVLWPRAAAKVRELIACDQKSAAIAEYFANVGQRWDDETLELVDGDVLPADFRTQPRRFSFATRRIIV